MSKSPPTLVSLGWSQTWSQAFEPWHAAGHAPGRISSDHQHIYRVFTELGELVAAVSGRLRHEAQAAANFPVVGDWVALSPRPGERRATIHGVLPRSSRFSRKVAGEQAEEQVVAANVDTVLLVAGLDANFNPRRIERALLLARDSGARPVVILSKADLCDRLDERLRQTQSIAAGVPVHALSPKRREGIQALAPYLLPGQTLALLGSSGVGKSTLINALLGEERQRTREVRLADSRGRHTTTHRELIPLPGGALVIDTPGMREMQLWTEADGMAGTFGDIDALAADCGFRDCRHQVEPRCAVRAAVADGRLAAERLSSYHKLEAELRALEWRRDQLAQQAEKRKWKSIEKSVRRLKPSRR